MAKKITAEQAAKIEQFQEHLMNFDWSLRETDEREFIDLIRESLEASGFDFENLDHVNRSMEEVLEPIWTDLGQQEKEIAARTQEIFRSAGATEAQLAWGMLDSVHLTRKQERELDKLVIKMDEVHIKMLPVMGLAAVLNEARRKLTA